MVRTAQSSQSGGRRTAAHTCRQLQRSGESFAKETTGSGNLARPRGRGRPQPVVMACQNPRRNAALCSAVTPFSARTARIFSGGSSAHPPWVAPRRRRSSANARPALRPASTGCSCILIQVLHPLADISNTPSSGCPQWLGIPRRSCSAIRSTISTNAAAAPRSPAATIIDIHVRLRLNIPRTVAWGVRASLLPSCAGAQTTARTP
jgi:hypothetical protein